MDRTKYVVVEEGGLLVPILFSHLVPHSKFRHWNPVSAGFVSIDPVSSGDGQTTTVVSVFGKSDSLDITSKPEDAGLIRKMILPQQY